MHNLEGTSEVCIYVGHMIGHNNKNAYFYEFGQYYMNICVVHHHPHDITWCRWLNCIIPCIGVVAHGFMHYHVAER